MTRRLNRILTIVTAAILVTAMWSSIGHTAWAGTRDYLSAGLQLDTWYEPVVWFGGMWLAALGLVRGTERLWSVLAPKPERIRRNPAPRHLEAAGG